MLKAENRILSRVRIMAEHTIGGLKRYTFSLPTFSIVTITFMTTSLPSLCCSLEFLALMKEEL